jgi:hypothetical protein
MEMEKFLTRYLFSYKGRERTVSTLQYAAPTPCTAKEIRVYIYQQIVPRKLPLNLFQSIND